MHKGFLKIAFILGALTVMLGAFGAHAIKDIVSQRVVVTFETAVRYQFYHVIALVFVAILFKDFSHKLLLAAGWFFIAGIILFCGSLFMLCYVQAMVQPGYTWLGPITPFGGVALITGWLLMFFAVFKNK